MNYKITENHSKATARVVHKCKTCDKNIQSFCNSRQHQLKEHGAQRGSIAQSVDVAQLMKNVAANSLKGELQTGKRFLVDSELENGRHRVYNFATDTLDPKCLLENLDVMFDSLKCTARLNLAFGCVAKNVADGSSRYNSAQKNNTLLERSKLVATTDDLKKIKNLLSNADVIESCTRERTYTKWEFYQLTNVQIFAALPKGVPWAARTLYCQIHF